MEIIQATIHATQNQLDHLSRDLGIKYEICQVFENGTIIYDDSGEAILQRYAEQRGKPPSEVPIWDNLDHQVKTGLMAMAAESPHWGSEGDLDQYRIQQFEQQFPELSLPTTDQC